MEITETERLMLVKKKEEICGLTLWILGNASQPRKAVQIKKNITMVLSLLNTIASYSDAKNCNIDGLREIADHIFFDLNQFLEQMKKTQKQEHIENVTQEKIQSIRNDIVFGSELFCNYANSVRFNFTKKGLKIVLPKITLPKNLNIGNVTNM